MAQVNSECTAKRIPLARPEGKRGIGRPKMKWLDGVNQDSAKIGQRNCRRHARNEDEWKKLLRRLGHTWGCGANYNDGDSHLHLSLQIMRSPNRTRCWECWSLKPSLCYLVGMQRMQTCFGSLGVHVVPTILCPTQNVDSRS